MPITRTAMVDDDGSGTTGTILNNAWKQEFYGQIDAALGLWQDLPYASGNYAAGSGGTWAVASGNQTVYAYQVTGNTLVVNLYLSSTTVTGTPAALNVALPLAAVQGFGQSFTYSCASGLGAGFAVTSGSTLILYRDILGTPWPAGAVHLAGTLIARTA